MTELWLADAPEAARERLVVDTEVAVGIDRLPHRARCADCGARRVLIRIAAGTARSRARCAPCWGIREEVA